MTDEIQLIREINCENSFRSRLYSNGIIEVYYSPNLNTVEVSDLINLKQSVFDLGKGKKMYIYMEILEFSNITPEARKFSATKNYAEFISASAILIDNLAKRMMLNFYNTINKPIIPTKGFSSKENAIEWLLELKRNEYLSVLNT